MQRIKRINDQAKIPNIFLEITFFFPLFSIIHANYIIDIFIDRIAGRKK